MLRYVERTGLIAPERSASGYRLYGPAQLQRLRTLKELLVRFDIGLSDVAFASRMAHDGELRQAVHKLPAVGKILVHAEQGGSLRFTAPPGPVQDVGRLFPVISPSPAAEPPPAAGPSPAATPQPGQTSQPRPTAAAQDKDLALNESLTGSKQVGLLFTLLVAAGGASWLLLGRARRRRVPVSLGPAGPSGPFRPLPGISVPVRPGTGPIRDAGRPSRVITPPSAAAPYPAATPSPAALLQPGQVRHRAPATDQDRPLSEPLTGNKQARLVFTLLVAAGAIAWLLGKARKRRVP